MKTDSMSTVSISTGISQTGSSSTPKCEPEGENPARIRTIGLTVGVYPLNMLQWHTGFTLVSPDVDAFLIHTVMSKHTYTHTHALLKGLRRAHVNTHRHSRPAGQNSALRLHGSYSTCQSCSGPTSSQGSRAGSVTLASWTAEAPPTHSAYQQK